MNRVPNQNKYPKLNPSIFGVSQIDPGYLYLFEAGSRLKVGKTKKPKQRVQNARTWIPDLNVLGIKPFWNYSALERYLQLGLTHFWYDREWFEIHEEEFREFFISEFQAYSDTDRDSNSVNFIYWMNGSGMATFVTELNRQGISKAKFQGQESSVTREKELRKTN